ncbi:MAG: DUF4349 domain-containing protein [bacterium]
MSFTARRTTVLRRGAIVAACALALVLAGCGGSGSTSDSGAMPPDMAAPEAAPESVTGSGTTVDETPREVIRNADISLRVNDVRAAVEQAGAIADAAGGRVAGESLSAQGESYYGNLTLRVPADRLDAVLSELGALGDVQSVNVTAEDVTAQAVDLDARIAALETSIARLQQLLSQATTTKDIIDIESELTARQAELDSLNAQRAALSDAVALSTVYVSVTPLTSEPEWTPPGFLAGLQTGWSAMLNFVAGLITVAGFALPFLLLLAVIAVPIVVIVLIIARRRRRPR